MSEDSLQVASAVDDTKDVHVFFLDAIHNHVLSNGKAPTISAKLIFTAATQIWMAREKKETLRDRVEQTICYFSTRAFVSHV